MHLLIRFKGLVAFLLGLFLLVGCGQIPEESVLLFPVREVGDNSTTRSLAPKQVFPDSVPLSGFRIVGDCLVSSAGFMSDHFIDIYDLSTGELKESFCRKGRGPGEFLAISPLFSSDGDVLSLYDAGTGLYTQMKLNLLEIDSAEIVNQVKIIVPDGKNAPVIMSTYRMNDREMLAYNSIQGELGYVNIESPYYAIYDVITGRELQTYNIFDANLIKKRSGEYEQMVSLALDDCLDDRKERLCFVMNQMPIVAIVDLASGKTQGIRLKGAVPYSADNPVFHFRSVCADESHIYALYYGKRPEEVLPESTDTLMYVFDWNGNFVEKISLNGLFLSCRNSQDKIYLARLGLDQQTYLYELSKKDVFD